MAPTSKRHTHSTKRLTPSSPGCLRRARALKPQDIPNYWDDPEDNRDWAELQVARFVDLALGNNQGDA
jgi:hypothetical protein